MPSQDVEIVKVVADGSGDDDAAASVGHRASDGEQAGGEDEENDGRAR